MVGSIHAPSTAPALALARCIVVMGVCGCGKSTFARELADAHGCDFLDADEYHPAANVGAPMAALACGANPRKQGSKWFTFFYEAQRRGHLSADKMRQGIPLDDNDRWPWLHELASIIDAYLASDRRLVMGCSALKEAYRDVLRGRHPDDVLFVLLQPSRDELLRRLDARTKVGGHFMPATLLDSQLATLEPHGRNVIALQGDRDAKELLTSFLGS